MSSSDEATEEILAELDAIQSWGAGVRGAKAFERARTLIGHADNTVRWQALIAVGNWIRSSPDAVWTVVVEHGESEDDDMRTGVATVLLEHLLEYHFDAYFPLLRDRIEAGATRLADTLSRCGAFGDARARWAEVRELLLKAKGSDHYVIRGKRYARIRHAGESGGPAAGSGPCEGCGVSAGELHDVCDLERCPACGGAALSCECPHVDCDEDEGQGA